MIKPMALALTLCVGLSACAPQGAYGGNPGASCGQASDNTLGGAALGAVGGALLGNGLSSHGSRGTGTVLGALAGGAAGGFIGNGVSSSRPCPVYGYSHAKPYRYEGYRGDPRY